MYSDNILSDCVYTQGRLNSLFIIFIKHANFFRVLIRLFSISFLNLYVGYLVAYSNMGVEL